eukprot:TRINITY_DN4107_c0_g1_i1.p1 TRINITY_DN4107_c0_g1~~TRINITY_DN4107_c0_g1_i1.p1  ORF type:complete len:201 (-),score=49.21 TRINITY_DN4107_c0_g1_i1:104-706(-)
MAVRKRHYQIAEFILQSGFDDVNALLKLNNRTVLFDLAEQKEKSDALLKILFQDKRIPVEINVTDKDQATLLHHAAKFGNVIAAKLFLERGVSANDEDKHGDTALHIAVENNDIEMVRALLSINPNTNSPFVHVDHLNSKTGRGAIHNAVKRDFYEVTEVLLEGGANSNLYETELGRTPIYICVENYVNELNQGQPASSV